MQSRLGWIWTALGDAVINQAVIERDDDAEQIEDQGLNLILQTRSHSVCLCDRVVKTGVVVALIIKPDIPLAQFSRNSLKKFSAITA